LNDSRGWRAFGLTRRLQDDALIEREFQAQKAALARSVLKNAQVFTDFQWGNFYMSVLSPTRTSDRSPFAAAPASERGGLFETKYLVAAFTPDRCLVVLLRGPDSDDEVRGGLRLAGIRNVVVIAGDTEAHFAGLQCPDCPCSHERHCAGADKPHLRMLMVFDLLRRRSRRKECNVRLKPDVVRKHPQKIVM